MALEATVDEAGIKTGSHIPGNTRANVKALWIFTGLWNLVSAPVLVYIPPELARQPLAGLGFLFPLVGAGLIVWASLTTARATRFGTTWLEAGGEARPGGTWQATVHARLPAPDDGTRFTVSVKLTCLSRSLSRRGNDTNQRENILWREEMDVDSTAIAFAAEHASIPVRFDVPADALETTAAGKGAGILWVLTAEAVLPGVNLKEDFDVPVRRAPGSEDTGPCARGASDDVQLRKGPAVSIDDLARTGITVEPSPDGMRFAFAARRNVAFASGVTALTAVFVAALWLQWYLSFPWFFRILTGLVDLLLVFVVVDLWLGVTTVVAANGELRVRHSVLGAGRQRTLLAGEVASIDLHINMQTQGRYGTPYYQVRAKLKNGRTAGLGDGIRNKRHAEWLAAQMRAAIGLRPV
jgi:hypothetical protein